MLKNITSSRLSWLSLMIFSFGMVGFAVFYQKHFDIEPCYLCILQRISLIIIGLFAILPLILPNNPHTRQVGYVGWLIGSISGLASSIKLNILQSTENLFSSCSISAESLIENIGFLKSIPILFEGSGDCSKSAGSFIGVTFEQWTLVLFSTLLITLLVIIILRAKQRLKD
jgi:protein dithiol:quinone oxidoreductase